MVVYGFDTARTIRAVWASVSSRKRLCTLATTKSKRASTSSGKSSEPSARMSDSMPLKESMQNCGGRSGCCWKRLIIVGGPEARIAMAEGVLERVVQHGGAHVQEGLHARSAPAHLLPLVQAPGHDLVDRALHERGRDRLTTPTPSSVMHQRCLVALEVAQKLADVSLKTADARHVTHRRALRPAAQGRELAPAPRPAPVPQAPLRAVQAANRRVSEVGVGHACAETPRHLQRVLEAHGGVPPVQHDRGTRQHLAL